MLSNCRRKMTRGQKSEYFRMPVLGKGKEKKDGGGKSARERELETKQKLPRNYMENQIFQPLHDGWCSNLPPVIF